MCAFNACINAMSLTYGNGSGHGTSPLAAVGAASGLFAATPPSAAIGVVEVEVAAGRGFHQVNVLVRFEVFARSGEGEIKLRHC